MRRRPSHGERWLRRAGFLLVAGSVGLALADRWLTAAIGQRFDKAMAVITAASAKPLDQAAPVASSSLVWSPFPKHVRFETGERWIVKGKRQRLFGIQACLRGTYFTNAASAKVDCGEAAIALIANLTNEADTRCAAVEKLDDYNDLVICQVKIRANRYDLGTYLTLSGFAFAALMPSGDPVHLPYFINELGARKNKLGLWRFSNLPHPATLLAAARKRAAKP